MNFARTILLFEFKMTESHNRRTLACQFMAVGTLPGKAVLIICVGGFAVRMCGCVSDEAIVANNDGLARVYCT